MSLKRGHKEDESVSSEFSKNVKSIQPLRLRFGFHSKQPKSTLKTAAVLRKSHLLRKKVLVRKKFIDLIEEEILERYEI